jgi:type II secretion system protein H
MSVSSPKCNTKDGFTLLELLVVLAILAVVLSVVAPNLSFQNTEEKLSTEAHSLRFALQDVVDQSWLTGVTVIVSQEADASWKVWQEKEGKWGKSNLLYQKNPDIAIQIKTDPQAVKQAAEILGFENNAVFIFLSSGEYIPFSITLTAAEKTKTLEGDGINGITLQSL